LYFEKITKKAPDAWPQAIAGTVGLNVNMKGLLTILFLSTIYSASATHWMTYYVYVETEYIQGTWTRTDILEKSDYKYLAPHIFQDLFGTEDIGLITTMLSKLKEKNPDDYKWTYELSVQGDTVILTTNETITELTTVKNEITATITLNNFKAVTFRIGDTEQTLTIEDLTLPYLDLVEPGTKTVEPQQVIAVETDTPETQETVEVTVTQEMPNEVRNPLTIWLIISGLLNIVLIGLIIKNKKH